MKNASRHGFTLIELSIVLVIIGLIVGGVLVGRDMILAAQIRAEVAQLEQIQAAINTFRTKYNGLPGDLPNASQFGFTARAGTNALGDGDGVIETSSAIVSYMSDPDFGSVPYWNNLIGEASYGWQDLSTANLVAGVFDGSQTTPAPGTSFPTLKTRNGFGIVMYGYDGTNYLGIGAYRPGANLVQGRSISPTNAYNIDTKIDDGKPAGGRMIAMQGMSSINRIANVLQDGMFGCSDLDYYIGNASRASYTVQLDNLECPLRFMLR